MKVTVDAKAVQRSLALVKPAMPAATHYGLPVLSHVSCETAEGRLVIRGTDLDLYASSSVEAAVHADGMVLASFAGLVAACKGKGSCVISLEGDHLSVTVAGVVRNVPTMPVDEAPKQLRGVLDPCDGSSVTVSADELGWVVSAVSTDPMRPPLTGVYVDAEMQSVVATDAYRLHKAPAAVSGRSVLIPARMFRAALKASPKLETLTFTYGARVARWSVDDAVYVCRLLDMDFPRYQSLIPTVRMTLGVTVNTAATAIALTAFPKKTKRGLRLIRQGDRLVFRIAEPETETSMSVLGFEGWDEGQEVAYNPAFLGDLIAGRGKSVTLEAAAPEKPLRLLAGDCVGLLMPVRNA